MPKPYFLKWTERSLINAKEISDWIFFKFSQKEKDHFFELLKDFEKIVVEFPEMYPESELNPRIYQAVVHKNLSIYYQFEEPLITIVAMRDNRMNSKKL